MSYTHQSKNIVIIFRKFSRFLKYNVSIVLFICHIDIIVLMNLLGCWNCPDRW